MIDLDRTARGVSPDRATGRIESRVDQTSQLRVAAAIVGDASNKCNFYRACPHALIAMPRRLVMGRAGKQLIAVEKMVEPSASSQRVDHVPIIDNVAALAL